MNFKNITGKLLLIAAMGLVGCKTDDPGNTFDAAAANKTADSLSIKLNSPSLKAVNQELLNNPNDPALYDKRARVYLGLREFAEAENDAKRAITLDSTQAPFHLTMADIHFSQNKTREAREYLERTTQKFPENTEALLKLAELYFLVKYYQDGITYVNKALKVDEHLAKGYYIKGSIYRESGDTARAVSSLQTAVEQDNNFKDAYHDLGVIYGARKNPLALEYYNNVLRIDPKDENALYGRAKFLQDVGKIDEAITEYERIIALDGKCDNCHYNIGAIYLEIKKDPKKALERFTKAIAVNPGYTAAYFARGYTYTKLNDKQSARADYNMCLRLEPNYAPAIEALNEL